MVRTLRECRKCYGTNGYLTKLLARSTPRQGKVLPNWEVGIYVRGCWGNRQIQLNKGEKVLNIDNLNEQANDSLFPSNIVSLGYFSDKERYS